MALRIPMAAWMTTLHMFFFCSFIFLIFKGLILIYESTGLQVYESGHYLLTCCLVDLLSPPLCIAKVQHREGGKGVTGRCLEERGNRGN